MLACLNNVVTGLIRLHGGRNWAQVRRDFDYRFNRALQRFALTQRKPG
ncbi:MAG: hypothetical protein H0U76_02530 [Ktedonobacteraceae bacterium]|nr:hypothetical protein [Ktedonobacteraceae bacterium]